MSSRLEPEGEAQKGAARPGKARARSPVAASISLLAPRRGGMGGGRKALARVIFPELTIVGARVAVAVLGVAPDVD
jgi:hypothetical protein